MPPCRPRTTDALQLLQRNRGQIEVEDRAGRCRGQCGDECDRGGRGRLHGVGSAPERIETARPLTPSCAPVSTAPTVPSAGRSADVHARLMPEKMSRVWGEAAERTDDGREGGGGVESVDGDVLGRRRCARPVPDRLTFIDRAHRGRGAALVGRGATTTTSRASPSPPPPIRRGLGRERQARARAPVVVGYQDSHAGLRYRRPLCPRTRCQMTSSDPSPTISPTGEQWAIAHGRQQVIVTEVGATLRSYRVGDDEMLDGFGANEWSRAEGDRCSPRGRTGSVTGATSSAASLPRLPQRA